MGIVSGEKYHVQTATILNGATTSDAVNVDSKIVTGIDLGATLTGTTLGFSHSVDGTTYRVAYDDSGSIIAWTVAGGRFLTFNPPLMGYKWIKLISGSSEGGDRTLQVVSAP
jgi:YD repeat-containing protein